ncbi:hypothetical protein [Nonomuraea sp. SYSU D8015]|uniref:hypothetical protein n=1 Tax=Nonomuraea sp. SYSU D8015 TaxID=2593644 RepID=UPI001661087E|nr:hypothetical protein [Nonomuraea sp. SYSU D8015]
MTRLVPVHGCAVCAPSAGEELRLRSIAVVSAGEEDGDLLERLDVACFEHGVRWTQARYAAGILRLAPASTSISRPA